MKVCPTDVVLASAERIWQLLTDPRQLAKWTGLKLVEGPAHTMRAGDHVVLGFSRLRIRFDVLEVRPPRELTLDVRFPFGITNHERIHIAPIDAHASRVTYN